MNNKDDYHSMDDDPPPEPEGINVKRIIKKLSSRHELSDYAHQLTAYHAAHLSDETAELKERLLLQGLDEDDIHSIHEFLKVKFDGEIMKMTDKDDTAKRVIQLDRFLKI